MACGAAVAALLIAGSAQADVFNMGSGLTSLEFVTVGNPGNAPDMRYNLEQRPEGYGAVDYIYDIGKYEVTSGQYAEFLNAVARTDVYELYSSDMWLDPLGCRIQQVGSAGNYSYTVAAGYENRPVNFVSWSDAARFTNWLTSGDTESGVYHFALDGSISSLVNHAIAYETFGRTAYCFVKRKCSGCRFGFTREITVLRNVANP